MSGYSPRLLLPTVKVKILDKYGRYVYVRAAFTTNSLVERLGLNTVPQSQNIIGITNKSTKIHKSVTLPIESCLYQDVHFNVDCHVVESITTSLPLLVGVVYGG